MSTDFPAQVHNQAHSGLGYWVGSLASAMRRGLERKLAPLGVSPAQWPILEMCCAGEANTLTGLSRVMPVDTAAICRHVDRLVARGLVQRRRSVRDRRSVRITLTAAGRELVPRLAHLAYANNDQFLNLLDSAEQGEFVRMLQKILTNVTVQEDECE